MFDIYKEELKYGGKKLILETGRIARQATSAVLVTYGETQVLCTVVAAKEAVENQDFFPLSVPFLAAFNSFKSCPDENVDPSPEIIITLTFLSRLALSKPFCIKSIIFSERAFKFSGLFKLKRITPFSFK